MEPAAAAQTAAGKTAASSETAARRAGGETAAAAQTAARQTARALALSE